MSHKKDTIKSENNMNFTDHDKQVDSSPYKMNRKIKLRWYN